MAFDLDAVLAEAKPKKKPKLFTFTFGGEEYTLPPELDALALAAVDSGGPRANEGLRKLLGPEQYDAILASPVVLTRDALKQLLDAYAVHMVGVDAGESSASPGSSKSTVTPLKRPSRPRTPARGSRPSAPKS